MFLATEVLPACVLTFRTRSWRRVEHEAAAQTYGLRELH